MIFAAAVIGHPAIDAARATLVQLKVYATIKSFVAAGDRLGDWPGAYVNKWDDPAEIMCAFVGVADIRCETQALADRLRAVFARATPAVRGPQRWELDEYQSVSRGVVRGWRLVG
jgi:hypothetical protein